MPDNRPDDASMRDDRTLERLAKRFSPEDHEEFLLRLRRSPNFIGDLEWLSRLLDAADSLPMPEVPPEVSGRLHALLDRPPALVVEEPTVLHDSRRDSELVGVRGTADRESWSLTLSAEHADVLLDGRLVSASTTNISGHVLSRDAARERYLVSASGPSRVTVRADDLGQFVLGELPRGAYEMTARSSDVELRWSMEIS